MLAVVAALTASACSSWPQFRQGPARAGSNSSETAITVDNVSALTTVWTADLGGNSASSPSVANNTVYVESHASELLAFDATGTGCTGTPPVCAPRWRTPAGTASFIGSPAIDGGLVFSVGADTLYAFDAAGTQGCSGMPKTCAPVWQAPIGTNTSSPAVANGVVYIAGDSRLLAFDAMGNTGCGGSPKTCAPLWSGVTFCDDCPLQTPAVADGRVYVVSEEAPQSLGFGRLYAFDAAGDDGCAGIPTSCIPLWYADTSGPAYGSTPAVADGVVYVSTYFNPTPGVFGGALLAFDAAGVRDCTGSPVPKCSPLWFASIGRSFASVGVANGVVYTASQDRVLFAFDEAAATGCNGSAPKECTPLWRSTVGGPVHDSAYVQSSPSLANGVAYVGSDNGNVYAFDAAGAASCSGTPKLCAPLWSAATGGAVASSPTIVNGYVYVASGDGHLYAYRLPASSTTN